MVLQLPGGAAALWTGNAGLQEGAVMGQQGFYQGAAEGRWGFDAGLRRGASRGCQRAAGRRRGFGTGSQGMPDGCRGAAGLWRGALGGC
ncbi:hypothetical protein GUJ93_ZPchr0013g33972 [Zizania palustris]|uniref:Uncharacterized protein n=1 Tax=Zizania palustris TaxID=103762 RepID=A0A8J5WQQ4_ZIZPA|nr:hypothetical protein GUJ93_ZPchr0013g33972 [Zizania palustris]